MMETNNLDKLINPTQLAQKMAYWTVDLEDAARYLHEGFPIRSIDEVIDNTIQRKAQVSNCTEAEIEAALGNCVGSQNLRNWRTPGNSKSLRRDSAMKIAFALGMSYEEAEEFLKRCWLDGFYMRDVQDIIYRHGPRQIAYTPQRGNRHHDDSEGARCCILPHRLRSHGAMLAAIQTH